MQEEYPYPPDYDLENTFQTSTAALALRFAALDEPTDPPFSPWSNGTGESRI